jgi:hypothetical protein
MTITFPWSCIAERQLCSIPAAWSSSKAMDHAREHIGIGPWRDRDNGVSLDYLATRGKTGNGNSLARLRGDFRQVEDSATHLRVLLEYWEQ